MTKAFPSDYPRYMGRSLSRFLPAANNLVSALKTTFPFAWRFAWRKEYPSCCAWLAGLAGLELYKDVLAYGWTWSWSSNAFRVGVMVICGTVMLFIGLRKQHAKIASAG